MEGPGLCNGERTGRPVGVDAAAVDAGEEAAVDAGPTGPFLRSAACRI